MGRGGSEVLDANTLREMQRVQFTDPDWKTTRGLGFRVWRADERTFVGHGGDCPGFRTAFHLQPDDRIATVFMANANGVASGSFAQQMYEIVAPAIRSATSSKDPVPTPDASLSRYQGTYDFTPWGGEMMVFPWEDGLAMLGLPTSQPLADLIRLRAVPGSPGRFRRVREMDVPGEPGRRRRSSHSTRPRSRGGWPRHPNWARGAAHLTASLGPPLASGAFVLTRWAPLRSGRATDQPPPPI